MTHEKRAIKMLFDLCVRANGYGDSKTEEWCGKLLRHIKEAVKADLIRELSQAQEGE